MCIRDSGNRKATKFYAVDGVNPKEFLQLCVLSSAADETPEGKSIVELGREQGFRFSQTDLVGFRMVNFTAETKCSGIDMPDGRRIRKGAAEALSLIHIYADHRILVPASILTGIVVMLLCDVLAKLLTFPINTITALLGIPIVIWVVIRNKSIV